MGEQPLLPDAQGVVPARLRVPPERGRGDRRQGRRGAAAPQVPPQAVRGRDGAGQLPAHQPRGPQAHRRDGRDQPRRGDAQPARRPQRGPSQHDGHHRLRARREHRRDAGQGRLPQRADRAHPVRAPDREGLRDADTLYPALDQQVLHPRPHAREEHGPLPRRAGLHGLHDLLEEPRRLDERDQVRGLHDGGTARRRRGRQGDNRVGEGQPGRLLRRRDAARDHRWPGSRPGATRTPSTPRPSWSRCRTSPTSATRRCS